VPRAWCGSIQRPWDPTGHEPGTVNVGFAFVPARDLQQPVLGTVVPHEGGPGYSTTGSAASYVAMYGPLLDRRNLLLVDQRGTGLSEPIDCPWLQQLTGRYAPAAGRCGRSLGIRSDNYTTAESADDLAAVIRALHLGPVDLYGDSYGTFFAQVFAGRHPALLRSVVLDSAYPTYGESAWYPTQTPAMRRSFTLACERSSPCASAGRTPMQLLRAVLAQVRVRPYRGISHTPGGRRVHVVVDGSSLVAVAFGATYGPSFYREFPAALRSALLGDRAPLLRLVAQATGGGSAPHSIAGKGRNYSEGLDAAVTCHDYPQLYDMRATPAVRRAELAAAVRREELSHPGVYGPFTIEDYLHSDWQELNWCTQWPVAAADNPARPPRPPGGHYAEVPTLILSGELDSITTPAEGAMVASQFPDSRQVVVANSFHVTADGDTDGCALNILRTFVRQATTRLSRSVVACAKQVPPVRTMGVFPETIAEVQPAHNVGGSRAGVLARRAATASAETVADLQDTWFNDYASHGVGLRGGTWSYQGDRVTTFTLRRVRFVRNLAVSGRAVWSRYWATMRVSLSLRGAGVSGRLSGTWQTRAARAKATLTGRIDGKLVGFHLPAP
jgi:pimeloyl-ACP methyl ester carboxylesterase